MSPLSRKIKERPNLAYELAIVIFIVASLLITATVGLYYNNKNTVNSAISKEAHDNKAEIILLKDAFCGKLNDPHNPGLLPLIANAPINSKTTALGHQLVSGAAHAATIIQCPGFQSNPTSTPSKN